MSPRPRDSNVAREESKRTVVDFDRHGETLRRARSDQDRRAQSPASGIHSARPARPEARAKGSAKYWVSWTTPSIVQFHDAYGIGWHPVIGDDTLADQRSVRQYSAHRKMPIGRVTSALSLDAIPPTETFSGLRIVQECPEA
jgi:hypothetical protein